MIMRNGLRVAAVLCVVALAMLQVVPVGAQSAQQPPLVIGVVDFDLIMNESKAAKSVKSQLDKQAAEFEAEYKKQQKAYQDKERKLLEQRASLSEAEFKQKAADLNAQTDKAEEALTQKKRALDSGVKKAVGQIKKSLLEIVADIAKKRGLTMVLDKSTVPLSHTDYDFTEEAMKSLDAKLPSVKLQVSS
jgi:Skp family chaperone for outer membrane proteins